MFINSVSLTASVAEYQSHYIEVVQGAIFMEQNMRFEPVGNNKKKFWADYEQFLGLNIHIQLCIALLETPPCMTST